MRTRSSGRVYSPAGCGCLVMYLLPFMAVGAGAFAVMAGYAIFAVLMLVAAIALSVYLVWRGYAAKPVTTGVKILIAIMIALYALSVPYLAFVGYLFIR